MMNFSSPKLSRRLSYFARYYNRQDIVWDIGCDHAHLGFSFLDHEHLPIIHLVDPSLAVVERLKWKIEDADIPRASVFHDKGQNLILNKNKSHFIYIAGMGGPEIIEILENLIPQLSAGDQILISPHTKILEMRSFIRSKGEILLKESAIVDHDIWYPHFLLGHRGRHCSLYGDEIYQGEEGALYRKHLIAKLSKHRDNQSKDFLNFLKLL